MQRQRAACLVPAPCCRSWQTWRTGPASQRGLPNENGEARHARDIDAAYTQDQLNAVYPRSPLCWDAEIVHAIAYPAGGRRHVAMDRPVE